MGPVLTAIEELDGTLRARPRHELLGTGSVHASLIQGGQEYSSYPARCLLQGERRTIPGERREDVEAELRELMGDSRGSIAFPFGRDPMEVSPDEEIASSLRRIAAHASNIAELVIFLVRGEDVRHPDNPPANKGGRDKA